MCLLHVLASLRVELGLELAVAHLNHGFRGEEADSDQELVESTARELGIPFHTRTVDIVRLAKEWKTGVEDAGRRARHEFFAEIMKRGSLHALALAHTADDQAETILMHVVRGSGLAGLRGMQPVEQLRVSARYFPLLVLRPLLQTSKKKLLEYNQTHEVRSHEDYTNADSTYTRNRLRSQVMPVLASINPEVSRSLARLGFLASRYAQLARTQADRFLEAKSRQGKRIMSQSDFAALPEVVQWEVVRSIWAGKRVGDAEIGMDHVLRAAAWLGSARTGQILELPGFVRLIVRAGWVHGVRDPDPMDILARVPLNLPGKTPWGTGWIETDSMPVNDFLTRPKSTQEAGEGWIDAGRSGTSLYLRAYRPGDLIIPLGMQGKKKLQDLFTDEKIPREDRRATPLVVNELNEIVYVAGIRIAETFKVTDATTTVVHISWIRSLRQAQGGRDIER
ncbi:tRNA lysidine(34) synthetase TilS [Candidatus Wirthbacteria bacterium CG2_30_54_11]|uniref:tRNA(Ile)-lysidine synthase n=1 Tax=Candidatus Wirthbacteria bacterium CG2_30_54_11 TaxID=1817892 RepID=A0A1J5IYQ1_9BACT|nr:MAG: tRNA lysidine(34) synthetase TilS [Candidatus Wirthbacteria bacterium CG2_30_54_11]